MVVNHMKRIFIIFSLIPVLLFSQDVTVTAQIEGENYQDQPMKGTITVTHRKDAKIDAASFLMDGKSLQATFKNDVILSPDSPIVISIYEFKIPGVKKGLHFLPEISVKVGGKVYTSTSSTYEVMDANKHLPKEAQGQVVLGLEPFVEGSQPLYPGQRTKVGYRYIYNYNFTLTKEEVPLLEAQGFRKIGDKVMRDSTRDGVTTLEVSLTIEAVKPGTYSFGPSIIQGKAYKQDAYGGKQYFKKEYAAEAPTVNLTVAPFPERGKPPSFQGAIGEYSMDVTLLSPSEVSVGDKIRLQIVISGTGEIENIPMPEVCCQPGFSGFFRMSDLPPIERVDGSKKTFVVEMRPLSDSIQEIPSLAFSFFNPIDVTYGTVKSKPIPLKVLPLKEEPPVEEPKKTPEVPVEEPSPAKPTAIEIEGNFQLSSADLKNTPFGTWWVLLAIPIGAFILFYQINLRNTIQQQKTVVKQKNSRELFEEALQKEHGSSEFYNGLLSAFVLRLFEKGEINEMPNSTDELPKTGLSGEVRTFLGRIEELRFAGKKGQSADLMIEEAKGLFAKLEGKK